MRLSNVLLILLAAVFLVIVGTSCTDEDAARRHLRNLGYTDIRITGYDAFACGKGDTTCTEFSAVSPAGHRVTGAVGCGIGCGKACTIRFE